MEGRINPINEVKNVPLGEPKAGRFVQIGTRKTTGVDEAVMQHELHVKEGAKPIRQKKRNFGNERSQVIQEEVQRLLKLGYIQEVHYLEWISNVVLVPKTGGKWCMCVDFTDLNKACPKDSHLLPRIDLLESASKLKIYGVKLNPKKCLFGVEGGKFLGYLVTQRGIKANPDKIRAIQEMREPQTIKEVQQLTGRMAALNRFISQAGDRGLPFFRILRNIKNFQWTEECHRAFQELKSYLARPPLLSKPEPREPLLLYLATSAAVASAVLAKDNKGAHLPVYYTSHMFQAAEGRYNTVEKLVLARRITILKVRPEGRIQETNVVGHSHSESWMDEIRGYLETGNLPGDKGEARG
ncbi:UNVERIFIED_CONTAM: hypothetical protein Slati_4217300 [Sesamum latifolium]|uniref:Reverse transcriptase/retrotransposon-derived protein RNase H-like domain-containing protein n=1 Tax=Sesamum latifolium TaxID=2727402 RepID=A0AAW2TAV2_9LAMI